MDFFTDIGENDVFSITDMIDYDMKVGVDGGDDLLSNCNDLDINLNSNFDMQSDNLDLCNFDSKFDSLSWLHTPTVVKSETVLDEHHSDLLVNPQTGLPVPVPVAVVLPQPAVGSALLQAQESVTFQIPSVSTSSNNITVGQLLMNDFNIHSQQISQQKLRPQKTNQILYQQNQHNISVSQPSTPAKTISSNSSLQHNNIDQTATYPKPVYSYSCLIAMALKNSETGALPVNEIYNFILENFPFFKTAPDGWKNSVRHNLSLNKCFEKVDNPKITGNNSKKGCLWGLNPSKIDKMDEEIVKWRKKDPEAVKRSMSNPDMLEMLEKGLVGCRSPMLQNTCSSTPNIHLSHTPTLSVNTSNSSIPNAGGKIVGKAVAILPKDVLEIKPMKSVGMATDYLGGGIQKFDNILTDLTGSINWEAFNMGLLQADTPTLSQVLSTGAGNTGATLVALVPTAVNMGALLDAGSASVLTPQSQLLARTIPTLS